MQNTDPENSVKEPDMNYNNHSYTSRVLPGFGPDLD